MNDHWNASLYDDKHRFVSDYGTALLDLLDVKEGETILDLGCGTGALTEKIHRLGATVIGIDKSQNMIAMAKEKYPSLSFFVKDVTEMDYVETFDAVFSNAVLHWVKDAEKALQKIFQSLKRNGRFVAEFGGKDNIRSITSEIRVQFQERGLPWSDDRIPWYFPSIGEYTSLMEKVGFRVVFAAHFDRPTKLDGADGLKHWLAMFTGSIFDGVENELKEAIWTSVENRLQNTLYRDGQWTVDYKRIRVIGIKE